MTYDELLQFTELQRRVVVLEQKATDDNNMVLKKAPNFANRLVEAFERIEALEVRTHTDIEDLGARLTGMETAYQELTTSHNALCDALNNLTRSSHPPSKKTRYSLSEQHHQLLSPCYSPAVRNATLEEVAQMVEGIQLPDDDYAQISTLFTERVRQMKEVE